MTLRLFWIANDESMHTTLPPNKPYRCPLNYPKYVKNYDPYAHVKVFKAIIKANGET
jgi:hypothetical protein